MKNKTKTKQNNQKTNKQTNKTKQTWLDGRLKCTEHLVYICNKHTSCKCVIYLLKDYKLCQLIFRKEKIIIIISFKNKIIILLNHLFDMLMKCVTQFYYVFFLKTTPLLFYFEQLSHVTVTPYATWHCNLVQSQSFIFFPHIGPILF